MNTYCIVSPFSNFHSEIFALLFSDLGTADERMRGAQHPESKDHLPQQFKSVLDVPCTGIATAPQLK